MIRKGNIYNKWLPYQSEFSRFSSWANNHMEWAKMKKTNRRVAKKRFNQEV